MRLSLEDLKYLLVCLHGYDLSKSIDPNTGMQYLRARLNYRILSEKYSASSSTDVWNIVQAIVSEQLWVDKNLVNPQARFVEDLGAD